MININKKFIIAVVLLVVGFGLIAFLIMPGWHSADFTKIEIKNKEFKISILKDLLSQIDQFEQMEKEAEGVFSVLPNEKDVPALLVQFESLASNNGLVLESIDFTEESEKGDIKIREVSSGEEDGVRGDWQILAVNLKLNGSYGAFENYLKSLENNIRLTNVRSISFVSGQSRGGEEALSALFNFSLEVEVYYQVK